MCISRRTSYASVRPRERDRETAKSQESNSGEELGVGAEGFRFARTGTEYAQRAKTKMV